MLLRITDKCSMGCTHCLGDYTPDGEHMTKQVFEDAIDFIIKTNPIIHIAISGGEPTEHPQFTEFMEIVTNKLEKVTPSIPKLITITTNGFWCIDHPDESRHISNISSKNINISWQVSTDKRFYPKPLDIHHPLWNDPAFTLCEDCVLQIYPQGRALTNNIPYQSKAPKCFNLRSIMKNIKTPPIQLISKLQMATVALLQRGYSCTPSIGIHGEIHLGESRLCPPVASIYDPLSEIDNKIINFRCHQCEFLLPPEHIKYINS